MATRNSHADYTAEQLAKTLRAIVADGCPPKVLAEEAGCSQSLAYQWLNEADPAIPQGHYLAALTLGLAKRGNLRLLHLQMPAHLRIVEAEIDGDVEVNGSTMDEVADGTEVLGQARMAERGNNPDGIDAQAEELEAIAARLRGEADKLRQRLEGR